MKVIYMTVSLSLILAIGNAQAMHIDTSLERVYEPEISKNQPVKFDRLYLAGKTKDVEKTTTKTKKDGTVVTKKVTKTNDGKGNKETTRTTTTTSPSDNSSSTSGGGSGGASYEGQ